MEAGALTLWSGNAFRRSTTYHYVEQGSAPGFLETESKMKLNSFIDVDTNTNFSENAVIFLMTDWLLPWFGLTSYITILFVPGKYSPVQSK